MAFPGLLPPVIDDVTDEGERILVRARTPERPVACPGCAAVTGRVHGYHQRTLADVPVDARPMVVRVRIRRLVCPSLVCPTQGCRRTFREQLPGVLSRYQRRTCRLISRVGAVVRQLAGRGGARMLSALAVVVSRQTADTQRTGQPRPARTTAETALRQRSTIGAPDSKSWEDPSQPAEAIKAVTCIFAGHGLDRKVRPKGLEPLTF